MIDRFLSNRRPKIWKGNGLEIRSRTVRGDSRFPRASGPAIFVPRSANFRLSSGEFIDPTAVGWPTAVERREHRGKSVGCYGHGKIYRRPLAVSTPTTTTTITPRSRSRHRCTGQQGDDEKTLWCIRRRVTRYMVVTVTSGY